MKGKATGALSLLAFVVLLKSPQTHDALNDFLEALARKIGAWLRAVTHLQLHSTAQNIPDQSESKQVPPKRSKRKGPASITRGAVAKSRRAKARRPKSEQAR
jgi:hypothetical protein